MSWPFQFSHPLTDDGCFQREGEDSKCDFFWSKTADWRFCYLLAGTSCFLLDLVGIVNTELQNIGLLMCHHYSLLKVGMVINILSRNLQIYCKALLVCIR